jgi:hypothetical protein
MLVLALQFSRAASDQWSWGLAVIAGTALRYRRQVRALPDEGCSLKTEQ